MVLLKFHLFLDIAECETYQHDELPYHALHVTKKYLTESLQCYKISLLKGKSQHKSSQLRQSPQNS